MVGDTAGDIFRTDAQNQLLVVAKIALEVVMIDRS